MTAKADVLEWLTECAEQYEDGLSREERKNKRKVAAMKDNVYRAAIKEIKGLRREIERTDLTLSALITKNLKILGMLRLNAKSMDKVDQELEHLKKWSKVGNCLIRVRQSDPPILVKHENGIITANLDGYAIIPREEMLYGSPDEPAV